VVSLISRELSDPNPDSRPCSTDCSTCSLSWHARVVCTERDGATLVSRGVGSATRPRPPSHARRGRSMRGPCRSLHTSARCLVRRSPATSHVRSASRRCSTDRLAAHAGSRLPAGWRAHLGTDRQSHRLQLNPRVCGDIPPTRWIGTRSWRQQYSSQPQQVRRNPTCRGMSPQTRWVSCSRCDWRSVPRELASQQVVASQREPPVGQVLHRRLAERTCEVAGERRTRLALRCASSGTVTHAPARRAWLGGAAESRIRRRVIPTWRRRALSNDARMPMKGARRAVGRARSAAGCGVAQFAGDQRHTS